jgi:hypothetical protein
MAAVDPGVVVTTSARFPESERPPGDWLEEQRRQGREVFNQAESGAVEITLRPELLEVRGFLDGKTWSRRR